LVNRVVPVPTGINRWEVDRSRFPGDCPVVNGA
jgi:hypothetical protein